MGRTSKQHGEGREKRMLEQGSFDSNLAGGERGGKGFVTRPPLGGIRGHTAGLGHGP